MTNKNIIREAIKQEKDDIKEFEKRLEAGGNETVLFRRIERAKKEITRLGQLL